MMQALPADRFRLHRETRTMPVYELIATRAGETAPVIAGCARIHERREWQFHLPAHQHVRIRRAAQRPLGIGGTFDVSVKSAAREMLEDPSSMIAWRNRPGINRVTW
jgi:hypothetical protein